MRSTNPPLCTLARRFAAGLAKARAREELSQAQLAARSGHTPAYVSMIENYKRAPTLETIEHFAGALGLEVVDLFR